MKNLLIILLFTTIQVHGSNFYFSVADGDDTRSAVQAQNPATPWKTLTKLNSYFSSLVAGDSIMFKRGETFYGSITVNKRGTSVNPLKFGAYGTGANPIISGFVSVTSWVNLGGNKWESSAAVSTLATCKAAFINGYNVAKGRTPDAGYWLIPSTNGSTTITDSRLTTSVISVGAEVQIRTLMYKIDGQPITAVSGNTITFTAPTDEVNAGWGYFVQNDPKCLNLQNEWSYNTSTKKITVYSIGAPGSVKVPTIERGVDLNGFDYINFTGIDFQGFNKYGIDTDSQAGVKIRNCNFSVIGEDGIYAYPNSNRLMVTGCTLTDMGSRGIHAANADYGIVSGNSLLRIGHLPGMGTNGDDSYTGIIANGDNSEVSYNSLVNVGYCGIRWDGASTVIKNNFVNTTGYVKDDGAGIYSYPNQFGDVPHNQATRTCRDNIVLNSVGDLDGAHPYGRQQMALYADGQSPDIRFIHNYASGAKLGIFIHGGNNIFCDSNTTYDCDYGFYLLKYDGPIDGITNTHNIFVARTETQMAMFLHPGSNIMPASYYSDYNVICRPIDDDLTVEIDSLVGITNFNRNRSLAQLKSSAFNRGQDSHSTKSPIAATTVNLLNSKYNELTEARIIGLGGQVKDMNGVDHNGSKIFQPFESMVYIKTGEYIPAAYKTRYKIIKSN